MSFQEIFAYGLRNYFNFRGRANRAEFLWYTLFCLAFWVAIPGLFSGISLFVMLFSMTFVESASGKDPITVTTLIIVLTSVTFWLFVPLVPLITAGARRLHDIGRSGWWWLVAFVPLFGICLLFHWFVMRSEEDSNKYGSLPN